MTDRADPYANLARALEWLDAAIRARLENPAEQTLAEPPSFAPDGQPFTTLVEKLEPTYAELMILLLALAPHVAPGRLDDLLGRHVAEAGSLPEAGFARGQQHRGLIPTGETAVWLLGGGDLAARAGVQRLFRSTHWLMRHGIVVLDAPPAAEPLLSGRLVPDPELVEFILHASVTPPRFSRDFPAEYIDTEMEWDDLVLHQGTMKQIREIQNWIAFNTVVMGDWGLARRAKPGYRALFFGPPGTGKTLTATLLGKHTGRDVFRIDLSRVISKYIGETEQNLARLFDRAEHKDWILFFDEADALFGKRTDIRDAHDKYANQEVAYLLQRIESFNGLVILATNQRNNIDEAFLRRFQSVIHFPMPRAEERLRLWTHSFPAQVALSDDVNLQEISTRYEISGASIMNVVHHCAIEILADASPTLTRQRIENAILREFVKEGKVV